MRKVKLSRWLRLMLPAAGGIAAAAAFLGPAAAGTAPPPLPAVHTLLPGLRAAPASSVRTYYSTNWSGYVTSGHKGGYFYVQAYWTVPRLKCGKPVTVAGMWAGLNGFVKSDKTVEQGGTQAFCVKGKAYYDAFTEAYPFRPNKTIPHAVYARDQMLAWVEFESPDVYTVQVTDFTRNWTYTITYLHKKVPSSAEVITEAPGAPGNKTYPLADFGSMRYSQVDVDVNAKWTAKILIRHKGEANRDKVTGKPPAFSVIWLGN
jgi:hypothetical protein